jgi:hypothetical protein
MQPDMDHGSELKAELGSEAGSELGSEAGSDTDTASWFSVSSTSSTSILDTPVSIPTWCQAYPVYWNVLPPLEQSHLVICTTCPLTYLGLIGHMHQLQMCCRASLATHGASYAAYSFTDLCAQIHLATQQWREAYIPLLQKVGSQGTVAQVGAVAILLRRAWVTASEEQRASIHHSLQRYELEQFTSLHKALHLRTYQLFIHEQSLDSSHGPSSHGPSSHSSPSPHVHQTLAPYSSRWRSLPADERECCEVRRRSIQRTVTEWTRNWSTMIRARWRAHLAQRRRAQQALAVKRPASAFAYFVRDRWRLQQSLQPHTQYEPYFRTLVATWKTLSVEEQHPYREQSQGQWDNYHRQKKDRGQKRKCPEPCA